MKKILLIIILLLSILSLSSCKKKELLGAVTTFSINDNLSDGKGEKVRVNEFGKDVLSTLLLREYCTKK